VEPELFHAVQGGLRIRSKCGRGRPGKHVNLFGGLLVDARDGGTFSYSHSAKYRSVLVPVGVKHGHGTTWTSFPSEVFEAAIVSLLSEIKAKDIWSNGDAVHKVEALSGQLAEVENLITAWQTKMDDPDIVDAVAAKLAELHRQR